MTASSIRVLAPATALVLAASLSACTSSDDSDESSPQAAPESPTASASPSCAEGEVSGVTVTEKGPRRRTFAGLHSVGLAPGAEYREKDGRDSALRPRVTGDDAESGGPRLVRSVTRAAVNQLPRVTTSRAFVRFSHPESRNGTYVIIVRAARVRADWRATECVGGEPQQRSGTLVAWADPRAIIDECADAVEGRKAPAGALEAACA